MMSCRWAGQYRLLGDWGQCHPSRGISLGPTHLVDDHFEWLPSKRAGVSKGWVGWLERSGRERERVEVDGGKKINLERKLNGGGEWLEGLNACTDHARACQAWKNPKCERPFNSRKLHDTAASPNHHRLLHPFLEVCIEHAESSFM